MHLLMETAIGDSQHYGVLSFEEVDELKKELSVLATRIDATKRKLAIENKLRDAATSLNRLYTPNSRENVDASGKGQSQKRHRRSVMSRSSGSDLLSKTDDELAASIKKCEDLSQELWRLEKRSQDVQKKLLEHTAGVLQMTHKGFLEKDLPPQHSSGMNGYAEGLGNVHAFGDGIEFDDRSFYQALDTLLESVDSPADSKIASAFEQQTLSILATERKIWDLNRRLRDSISQSSGGAEVMPAPPAPETSERGDTEAALQGQIEYLEKGLDAMQQSRVETLQGLKESTYAAEEKLEDLNTQLRGIIIRSSQEPSSQYPLPPDVTGRSLQEQVAFLEGGLDALEQHVQRLKDDSLTSSSRSVAHEEKVGQYQNVLQGLWHTLFAGEETPGPFSLEAFSTKIQSLSSRVTGLQEQKDILGRQIQQQREINNKSDSEKDARMVEVTTELENAKRDLEVRSKEGMTENNVLKAQLAAGNDAKEQLLAELQEKHGVISNLETQIQIVKDEQQVLQNTAQEKSAEAERVRNELASYEGEMVRLQTELTVAKAELDGAYGTRAQRAAEVASHPALLQEINDLKEQNQALSEEVATGKSKQEAAGNAESQQRIQTLQKELSETIAEYEVMTKSSIEYEKEREQLENTIDGLRDRCETLESQLSDEKVQSLGVKSPGRPGSRESQGASSTSTTVLKNEFKKLMRETRQENMKALRVSQPRILFMECTKLFAVRAERTPQTRSPTPHIQQGSTTWKILSKPKHDGTLRTSKYTVLVLTAHAPRLGRRAWDTNSVMKATEMKHPRTASSAES